MKITRTSIFTGITRTKNLRITPDQMERWQSGTLIQNAFPNLSADDREFLMTGATREEWDKAFEDVQDEEETWLDHMKENK